MVKPIHVLFIVLLGKNILRQEVNTTGGFRDGEKIFRGEGDALPLNKTLARQIRTQLFSPLGTRSRTALLIILLKFPNRRFKDARCSVFDNL